MVTLIIRHPGFHIFKTRARRVQGTCGEDAHGRRGSVASGSDASWEGPRMRGIQSFHVSFNL